MMADAQRLINNGYWIVPLRAASPVPALARWTDPATRITDAAAYPGAWSQVAINTTHTPVIDLDIDDRALRCEMVAALTMEFGPAPLRHRGGARAAMLYQTTEPFGKKVSRKYRDFDHATHQVEILGRGQACTVYGQHADGSRYQWDGQSPLDVRADQLPVLAEADIDRVFDLFDELAGGYGVAVSEARTNRGAMSLTVALPHGAEVDEMQGLLDALPEGLADCYDTWLRVGMALHHETGGDEVGLELWEGWSMAGAGYEPEGCALKWGTFDSHPLRGGVSLSTIRYLAKTKPPQKKVNGMDLVEIADTLDRFMIRYVYDESGPAVIDTARPQPVPIKVHAFHDATLGKTVTYTTDKTDSTGERVEKTVPLSRVWLAREDKKVVFKHTYRPGSPRVVSSRGVRAWNDWAQPDHGQDQGIRPDPFIEHVSWLCPVSGEADWFLDWMAFCVKHPELRSSVTPLHISPGHGTGRGWVVRLLTLLVGADNTSRARIADLCGKTQFNGHLYRTVMCFVDEVREASDRYRVGDRMREALTETRLDINIKYGQQHHSARVYCNLLMLSNHVDALVIPPEDRRVQVLTGPSKTDVRGAAYYDDLYAWLDEPGHVAACYHWLSRRECQYLVSARSTHTPGRALLMEATRGEGETTLLEILEVLDGQGIPWVVGRDLRAATGLGPGLTHAMRRAGWSPDRLRLTQGRRVRGYKRDTLTFRDRETGPRDQWCKDSASVCLADWT